MLQKPERGSGKRERFERRQEARKHERAEMDAAKRRDHGKCRWPGCDSHIVKLRIDACHERDSHRGMGGNPDGKRTERAKVITLCLTHHAQYDRFDLDILPVTDKGFDGPCAFYVPHPMEDWRHIATEKVIGVSVTKT